MNNAKPQVIKPNQTNDQFPVQLRDLLKLSGFRDYPVLSRSFIRFADQFSFHQSVEYILHKKDYYLTDFFAKQYACFLDKDKGKGLQYARKLEATTKEAEQLKLKLLEKENEQLKLTATKNLNEWKPLRWFLQESNVSGYLDKFTERTNYRVITNTIFDRKIKKGMEDMVRLSGKALIFNPEYENEIIKILFDID